MEYETRKRLEELTKSDELLSICNFKDCQKIKIIVEGKEYWIGEGDLYKEVIAHYNTLNEELQRTNPSGSYFSGSLCPVHFEKEMKKYDFEE